MDPGLLRFILLLFVINLVFQIIRRFKEGFFLEPLYNSLLLVDAGLCLTALFVPGQLNSVYAWLGIGIFCGAVLIPALLSVLARIAMSRTRWDLAHRFLSLQQLFVPTLEGRQRLEHLVRMKKAHAGDVEDIERDLKAEISRVSDPLQKRLLQETLVEVLAFSGQWDRCMEAFSELAGDDQYELNRPTMAVAILRASLEVGDPDRMWEMHDALNRFDPMDPMLQSALVSSEIMLLSAHGYAGVIEKVLSPLDRPHPVFPVSSKKYWAARAHFQLGNHEKALEYLDFSPSMMRENPVLARLAGRLCRQPPTPFPEPEHKRRAQLEDMARRLPSRVLQIQPIRPPVATWVFLTGMALMFAVQGMLGDSDRFALYQLGANWRSMSISSEPWRLVMAMFLHAGVLHLLLNGLMIFMFGRILEVHFGFLRTFSVFVFSGIAGNVASAVAYRQGLSVGASSSVFGMVGAVLMMFIVARDMWHPVWRKKQIQHLVFLLVLNLFLGFTMPMIDNAAHIGGFLGGSLVGWFFLILRMNRPWKAALVRGIGLISLGLVIFGVTMAARNVRSIPRSITQWNQFGQQLSVERPVFWIPLRDSLQNPFCPIQPTFSVMQISTGESPTGQEDVIRLFLEKHESMGQGDNLKLVRRRVHRGRTEAHFDFTFQKIQGRERILFETRKGNIWAMRFVYADSCADSMVPFMDSMARSFSVSSTR